MTEQQHNPETLGNVYIAKYQTRYGTPAGKTNSFIVSKKTKRRASKLDGIEGVTPEELAEIANYKDRLVSKGC